MLLVFFFSFFCWGVCYCIYFFPFFVGVFGIVYFFTFFFVGVFVIVFLYVFLLGCLLLYIFFLRSLLGCCELKGDVVLQCRERYGVATQRWCHPSCGLADPSVPALQKEVRCHLRLQVHGLHMAAAGKASLAVPNPAAARLALGAKSN